MGFPDVYPLRHKITPRTAAAVLDLQYAYVQQILQNNNMQLKVL
jgi:hypothetical protein